MVTAMSEGIRTPDGATLLDGMCGCGAHCSNACEATHCPPGTRWCRCWCHSDRYRAMQERAPVEGDTRVRGKEIQVCHRGEWSALMILESEEEAREAYAEFLEDMRLGRNEV